MNFLSPYNITQNQNEHFSLISSIWRTADEPKNQHTSDLINAQKMSHKHNKDQSPMVCLTWHASKFVQGT